MHLLDGGAYWQARWNAWEQRAILEHMVLLVRHNEVTLTVIVTVTVTITSPSLRKPTRAAAQKKMVVTATGDMTVIVTVIVTVVVTVTDVLVPPDDYRGNCHRAADLCATSLTVFRICCYLCNHTQIAHHSKHTLALLRRLWQS